jgi:hypothetical protein
VNGDGIKTDRAATLNVGVQPRKQDAGTRKRGLHALLALLSTSAVLVAVAPAAPAVAAESPAATGERAYELVTPGNDPNDKKVEILPVARPSVTGEAIAFQMFGTPDGGASEIRNTFLAKREPEGWTSELLTPPAAPWTPHEYRISPNQFFQFNEDLSKVLVSSKNENPLVPGEADGGFTNLYLRDNDTGTYQLITAGTPERPPNGRPDLFPAAAPRVAWASKDLEHVLFDSYNGESVEYSPDWFWDSVIAWSPQTGMQVASVMPSGQVLSGSGGAGALQLAGPQSGEAFADWYGANEHAISEDGSRIYFTYPAPSGTYGGGPRPKGNLYLRRDNGTPLASTVQVDEPGPGAPPQQERESVSRFIDATPDGHRALFMSCGKLTADSTAQSSGAYSYCQPVGTAPNGKVNSDELYVYEEGVGLTDIATGDPNGGGVLGVAGVSEDLGRVYFVATGALAGNAVEGKQNLYLWEKGAGVTFLAQLSALRQFTWHEDADRFIWELPLGLNDAVVSADGSTIAFSSGAEIEPGYDNEDPESGDGFKEMYVWKVGQGTPKCITCIGQAVGPSTLLPQRLNETEAKLPVLAGWQKRNMLPDGSAVFFESSQQLLPADHNFTTDVYEYNFARESLSLISSGTGSSPSSFMGASVDGRDVFIRTSQSLVPSDINGGADIYDVRRGGGDLPEKPTPAVPCGENCPITPGSVNFNGAGNQPPVKPLTLATITAKQRAQFARTGRLTIVVGTPGAGLVLAHAIARPPAGKWRKVATTNLTAPGEGTQRLTLTLKKGVRNLLAKQGHLQMRIYVNQGEQEATAQLALTQKVAHAKKAKPKAKKHKGASKSKTASHGNA